MTSSSSAQHAVRPFLVVGFDGSPSSFLALDRAALLAPIVDADVRVVTTWMFPATYPSANYGNWSPRDDAKALAITAADHLFAGPAPDWFSTVIGEGMPTRILLEQSVGADMLIVGSRGHGGFAGLLLGSVSAACAEHASCPVLIMRGVAAPRPTAPEPALVSTRS